MELPCSICTTRFKKHSAAQAKWPGRPQVGIILGTGLGGLAQDIQAETTIPYEEIRISTFDGNVSRRRLVCGKLSGKTIVAMEGRFHYYEGYSLNRSPFQCG